MKLDVNKGKDGFNEWSVIRAGGGRVTVKLDGVEQERCTSVDEEAGYIEYVAADEMGRILLNNGNTVVRKRHGKVSVSVDYG